MYREANQLAFEVKKLLQHAGLKATKSLGQHFLADEKYLTVTISAAEVTPQDTIIGGFSKEDPGEIDGGRDRRGTTPPVRKCLLACSG